MTLQRTHVKTMYGGKVPSHEIRRASTRRILYQHIVDVLALLGGKTDDVLPICA